MRSCRRRPYGAWKDFLGEFENRGWGWSLVAIRRPVGARSWCRRAETWLNDAVKAYLSPRGDFDPSLDLPHLKVFVARPEYLLAMKCASMRLGEEFHDLDDVRYLLRHLNLTTVDEAFTIVGRYFDDDQLLPKTRLVLEEILDRSDS